MKMFGRSKKINQEAVGEGTWGQQPPLSSKPGSDATILAMSWCHHPRGTIPDYTATCDTKRIPTGQPFWSVHIYYVLQKFWPAVERCINSMNDVSFLGRESSINLSICQEQALVSAVNLQSSSDFCGAVLNHHDFRAASHCAFWGHSDL